MKNYTTKPIELPLSTEKEYVLVDESLTNDDFFCLDISVIKKPFKPAEIDISGDMWLNNSCVACVEGETNISSFHEVIRQPESEVEWSGEGLPPVGVVCCFTPDNNMWGFASTETYLGEVVRYEGEQFVFLLAHDEFKIRPCHLIVSRTDKGDFSKPETEAERKDRERLEAAIELHDLAQDVYFACDGGSDGSATWDKAPERVKSMYLAIVDKTNYRKEQN